MAHALSTIQDNWPRDRTLLRNALFQIWDSLGDTSHSDQLLRLDQTCQRFHLDGWFCSSESFSALLSLVFGQKEPSIPKARPILWVILALSTGSDPVVRQSSWQCLVSSLSSPVLSMRLRPRFSRLPNKPQHTSPQSPQLNSPSLSFLPPSSPSSVCAFARF